jgi:hypothetical protein
MISVISINPQKNEGNSVFAEAKEALVVDDFEGDEILNSLGNKSNVYVKAPSKVMVTRKPEARDGKPTTALLIRYDKANEGGPYGMGGWCGYYTLLKNEREGTYFDGSNCKYISFWLKSETGVENFTVGLSDRHWDKIGDSLKSEEIITYIPGGKMPTEWMLVRVPLEEFFLDYSQLAAITINFEGDCFPEGKGAGIVYIDDLMLEK